MLISHPPSPPSRPYPAHARPNLLVSSPAPTHPTPVSPPSQPHDHSDPHQFPLLSPTGPPTQPILYLPPILSSLPLPNPAGGTNATLPSGSVDPASLSLHKALHNFGPVDADYAVRGYDEAFNWGSLEVGEEEEREWYCVVFRSKRNEESRSSDRGLYEADAKAHEEAIRAGGLLMYWYGVPNAHSQANLATCIWQSRAAALAAIGGPEHVKAMRLAKGAYEYYVLERWVLGTKRGERGVRVRRWEVGEVDTGVINAAE